MLEGVPRPGVWVETSTWPPIEVHELGGWRVGFSGGFTRRGNSAVPRTALSAGPAALLSALTDVEAFYAGRGVPPVVRVSPEDAPDLDGLLADRGYQVVAPTLLMAAPTAGFSHGPGASSRHGQGRDDAPDLGVVGDIEVADTPDADWLAAWLGTKQGSTDDHALAARLLAGTSARYLAVRDATGVVGVLRAASSGRWVGLSCLAVAVRARRQGLGRKLAERALAEASVPWGFLQVEESNAAAVALCTELGFTVADRYHYRQR